MDFSVLLQKHRKEKSWKQSDVLDELKKRDCELKMAQSAYSSWERGGGLPSISKWGKIITALSEMYDLKPEEVQDALKESKEKSECGVGNEQRPSWLLTSKQYIASQKTIIRRFKLDNYQPIIWLLGCETMPLNKFIEFQQTWVENINKGVSYYLIWLLNNPKTDDALINSYEMIQEIRQKVHRNGKSDVGEIRNIVINKEANVDTTRFKIDPKKDTIVKPQKNCDAEYLWTNLSSYWSLLGPIAIFSGKDVGGFLKQPWDQNKIIAIGIPDQEAENYSFIYRSDWYAKDLWIYVDRLNHLHESMKLAMKY